MASQASYRHFRKARNAGDRLKAVEEIELTAEEEAAIDREQNEYMDRLALGGAADTALEPAREPFMRGGTMLFFEEKYDASVDPDLLAGEEILRRMVDERTRYDFTMNVSRLTIGVEKVVVKDGDDTRLISASTRDFGPPKSELTWNFLATLVILASQYAMPFNRLGGS